MAFFKMRKGGDESPATRRPPESIEAMRRRARHRLIGAGVLVLVGVIGFPLLFDTQPRPIAVDIPIEIPDRNKVKTLPAPAQPAAQAPTVSGPVTVAPRPPAAPEATAAVTPQPVPPAAVAEAPPTTKPEPKVAAQPELKKDEGAKAKALLEGRPVQVAAATDEGRYVVQVGAFADPAKARAARLKVERAGLKTYTNVADTKDGKRVRVRVGPFVTRAEADKAAQKLKGLDLPAAILTL
ncbi:MAG TPA: SPOR domain-containing protein [Ramlibacter sp.]|jgi:DedD protein